MDLGLNEQQQLMQAAARDWLDQNWTANVSASWIDGDEPLPPEALWQQLADLGWFGLSISEANGGLGGEFLDVVLLLEEMGAALFPATFASSLVTARLLDRLAQTDLNKQWVADLVAGKVGTLAFYGPDGMFLDATPTTELTYEGGRHVLRGTKLFVRDGAIADYIVVIASEHGAEGQRFVVVDSQAVGITRAPHSTLARDRQCELRFAGTTVDEDSIFTATPARLQQLRVDLMLAEAAYLVGVAASGHSMAVRYTQERVAFGRPIGAFQALQHKIADMTIDLESSRLVTQFATTRMLGETGFEDAMNAKWWVGGAANRILREAQQIHGGIGFTTDFPLHRYFKRAKAGELLFGAPHELLPRMAELVLESDRAAANALATV